MHPDSESGIIPWLPAHRALFACISYSTITPASADCDDLRKVPLANSKSARKRILVSERRRLRNRPFRSAARTYVKKAELAIAAGDKSAAQEAVLTATSTLDRVASKGVIHPNNAARRKSRLMKKFNALSA